MIFKQIASGSSGNCYIVEADNGRRILIDMGIDWKKILSGVGHRLSNIDFALCDHLHKDHSKCLEHVMKSGIDVYASRETFESQGLASNRRAKIVENNTLIRHKNFGVYCFSTVHDCEGSLGFVVREKATGEFLLFATDTKTIKQKFVHPFSIVAIECSYNGEYLAKKVREGTINESLAKRLLDSHMEETECLRYLQEFCNLSHCKEINLLHMSHDNINRDRVVKEFEAELFIDVRTI